MLQVKAASILIVDDDPVQRRLAEAALERENHHVETAGNGRDALDRVAARTDGFGAVVLDVVMPDIDGIAVLKALRAKGIETPVIVQTAQGSIDLAIEAMRAGAFDFMVKPVAPARLAEAVAKALKVSGSAASPRHRTSPGRGEGRRELVGDSPEMARVRHLIAKAAASDIPVLIEGESGTGKELVARAIAAGGPRARKALVVVNCGAIPDNLVESILFGHEKGAFTGATEKHVGKFVEADGGTLFLDEIGELPLAAQVKLLRALQEGHVEPVGARTGRRVDVRVISATNRDLVAAVREGRFREDLFYRLNVFPIISPTLRNRPGDIAQLARHFIERNTAGAGGGPVPQITGQAVELLSAYDWPGNIRQLENTIFRALVLNESGVLDIEDFAHIAAQLPARVTLHPAPRITSPEQPLPLPGEQARLAMPAPAAARETAPANPFVGPDGHVLALSDLEARAITQAIAHYRGQMSEVARRLGIGRSTLYRKLREYGIDAGS